MHSRKLVRERLLKKKYPTTIHAPVATIDPKEEYRQYCIQHLEDARKLPLPDSILPCQHKETVFLEFRELPSVEFVIRNTISKTGKDWSHTIVCGAKNFTFMERLATSIHPGLRVVMAPIDNMQNNMDYSRFLCTSSFWNLLQGEKILIYQEDSCLFGNHIDDFLQWDYIGAPWPKDWSVNSHHVGNGGFSLRSKSCMLEIIEKAPLTDPHIPEDVYFTTSMIKLNIGRVADFDTARMFATEHIGNEHALAGHAFWFSNPDWKSMLRRYCTPAV